MSLQDAIDAVDGVTLLVQILVSEGFIRLLSLLIVEETIDILQSSLCNVLE